jgi:hypothetical protein
MVRGINEERFYLATTERHEANRAVCLIDC